MEGGGVVNFAYAIVPRRTCLSSVDDGISNCQGGGLRAMVKGSDAMATN